MVNSYARGLLFRRLSALSGLSINNDTVEIKSIEAVKSLAGNTRITLTAKPGSFFAGTKILHYDRERLCSPSDELMVYIGDRKLAWTWELLEHIEASVGMRHLTSEIVNARLSDPIKPFISFANNHPIWLGGFGVTLIREMPKPDTNVKPDQTKRLANTLYDTVSFVDCGNVLKGFKVGQRLPFGFESVLNSKLTLGWVDSQEPAAFNIRNAVVLYNGPAGKVSSAKHKTMQLLRVSLDSSANRRVYGELFLYY